MGADVVDLEPVGGGPEGIGEFIQSSSAISVAFQGRDVGPDPPDGAGTEQISEQGCVTAHREAAEAAEGGELVISSADGGNGGSRIQRYWGLRQEEQE